MITENDLKQLSSKELEDLIQKARALSREKYEKELKTTIKSHKTFIGKCYKKYYEKNGMFPPMWRYFKVIGNRGSNEYHLPMLTFQEYPVYWFNYKASKIGNPGDYYLGHYDFEGIQIEDYGYFCSGWNKGFIEISNEEYNKAMNLYIQRLQELEWPADHYKWGNKKPGDEGWEGVNKDNE